MKIDHQMSSAFTCSASTAFHSCSLCLHATQTLGKEGGYNICFRWGFSCLPPECTSTMFSVYADTNFPNSKSQLIPINFTRKRKLFKQLTFALTKEQNCIFIIILSPSLPQGVFRELGPVWKNIQQRLNMKFVVFFSILVLFIFKSSSRI